MNYALVKHIFVNFKACGNMGDPRTGLLTLSTSEGKKKNLYREEGSFSVRGLCCWQRSQKWAPQIKIQLIEWSMNKAIRYSRFMIFVLEFPYPIRRGMMRNGFDGKVDCDLQSLALDGLDNAWGCYEPIAPIVIGGKGEIWRGSDKGA